MMPTARNRRAATSFLNDIKAMGSALLDSRKLAGAEKLAGLAEAAQTLSGSLDDTPFLKQYADLAGESLEGLASYIERTDVEDIFEDAVELAKAQPVLTLTLMIVGGVAATQMLRGWRADGIVMPLRSKRPAPARKSRKRKPSAHRKA
jgi:hypothetical protein